VSGALYGHLCSRGFDHQVIEKIIVYLGRGESVGWLIYHLFICMQAKLLRTFFGREHLAALLQILGTSLAKFVDEVISCM